MTTIIRGGRLLDIETHQAPPADILVEGDSLREIGLAGMAAQRLAEHPALNRGRGLEAQDIEHRRQDVDDAARQLGLEAGAERVAAGREPVAQLDRV